MSSSRKSSRGWSRSFSRRCPRNRPECRRPGHSSVFDEDHRSALAAPADRLKEQSRAQKQKAPVARGLSNEYGGDEGDRTLDLRIANATLSQLSYVPGADDCTAARTGRKSIRAQGKLGGRADFPLLNS